MDAECVNVQEKLKFIKMIIELKGLETGVTLITLSYKGKSYTTGCFFKEEAGEKIQLLINKAMQEHHGE